MTVRAQLSQSLDDFARRTVHLQMVRDRPDGQVDVWLGGDEWLTLGAAVVVDGPSGARLPLEAVAALREALDRFEGKTTDSATEAAVLREVLTVERERVNNLLAMVAR